MVGKAGSKLHCYDHCPEFIQATADERLRQVTKHGDCTYCLLRDHDTDAHISRAAGNPKNLQECGIYEKHNGLTCTSHQNSAFHGSTGHKQQSGSKQQGFHTKAHMPQSKVRSFPADAPALRDTGQATIRAEWEKSGRITRAEEMEEARRILHLPEVDGDRVLLLIHEVTMVTGKDRKQVKASLFNDKGSTCSMVSRQLVRLLGLESIKKTVVVQSFGHTDSIDTEFVVLELLKQDGSIALIRAYVVDTITTMAKVHIP